ncbi:MAG: hypothetical protein IT432_04780 [Phycisphaerales bacterium]|nr:hypothetical protein [Phycisphaerales bacterium]
MIAVGKYLSAVPDTALDKLRELTSEKIARRAPKFGAWLIDTLDDERVRRLRSATGIPREPDMPSLDMFAWSAAEVGDAIIAASVLTEVVVDPTMRAFLRRVNGIVVALAAHRLARIDVTREVQRNNLAD